MHFIFGLLLCALGMVDTEPEAQETPRPAQIVAAMLSVPDEDLDFARAQLAFDGLVQPATDVERVAIEPDALAFQASMLAGERPSDEEKINASAA